MLMGLSVREEYYRRYGRGHKIIAIDSFVPSRDPGRKPVVGKATQRALPQNDLYNPVDNLVNVEWALLRPRDCVMVVYLHRSFEEDPSGAQGALAVLQTSNLFGAIAKPINLAGCPSSELSISLSVKVIHIRLVCDMLFLRVPLYSSLSWSFRY